MGVSASFLSLVIQTYSPTVLVLGKFPGTDVYRDVERYDMVCESPEPNDDCIYMYIYASITFVYLLLLMVVVMFAAVLIGKDCTWHSLYAIWKLVTFCQH